MFYRLVTFSKIATNNVMLYFNNTYQLSMVVFNSTHILKTYLYLAMFS